MLDPIKAKCHYELYLKNKCKNIRKASEILKNPSSGNIKSVSVRNPKTVSNSLKPIIQ